MWAESVAYSSDSHTLALATFENTLKLWDVANDREKATLKGHTDRIFAVAYSPDGQTIATGSDDKTIKLWDVSNCR